MSNMEKVVIMKEPSIDSIGDSVLRECLRIMSPVYKIEIRSHPPVYSPDGEIHIELVKNQFAL